MTENPEQKVKEYTKKIFFFGTLDSVLSKASINHFVEKKFQGDLKPDFFVYDNVETVLEHKFSLTVKNERTLEEITECHTKYSKLIETNGKKTYNPQVIILIPITCVDAFENVKKDIKCDVVIWVFNLDVDNKRTISFNEAFGKAKNEKLRSLLLDKEFPINPPDFSKIKFLGDEPHPVYTSFILWQWLQTFKNPLTKEDFIDTDLSKILEIAESFCPAGMLDRTQLTKTRLHMALSFLSKIGFVKLLPSNKVRVFYRKGSKTMDLTHHFSEKWIELKPKELKSNFAESEKQQSLARWLKEPN